MKNFIENLACYGVNEKSFDTEELALGLAEQLGITVKHNQEFTALLQIDGEYFMSLDKKLRGIAKVFAILHEVAHWWLDSGNELDSIYFLGGGDEKLEFQADLLATVLLVHRAGLRNFDFLENHPNKQARQYYENRRKLDFLYDI